MEDHKEVYDDKCIVTREDIGVDVEGDILRFKPKEMIKLTIGKGVMLTLKYDSFGRVYIGEKARMPFVTKGPARLK